MIIVTILPATYVRKIATNLIKIIKRIATMQPQVVVENEFLKSKYCLHKNRLYDKKSGELSVVCRDCNLSGPFVKFELSESATKRRAISKFFDEANRVDNFYGRNDE